MKARSFKVCTQVPLVPCWEIPAGELLLPPWGGVWEEGVTTWRDAGQGSAAGGVELPGSSACSVLGVSGSNGSLSSWDALWLLLYNTKPANCSGEQHVSDEPWKEAKTACTVNQSNPPSSGIGDG